jgi:hypothetical protein
MNGLISMLSCGLSAAGLTLLVRAIIEWTGEHQRLQQKPWGCNLCMAFWTSLMTMLWTLEATRAEHLLGIYFVAYALLESFWRPLPPPLEESESPKLP